MARTGRSFPRPLVYLRALVIPVLAVQIHVVSAAKIPRPRPKTSFVYVRGAKATVPSLNYAPITVVTWNRRDVSTRTKDFSRVVFLRGAAAVPARIAPQLTIVAQSQQHKLVRVRTASHIYVLRGAPSTVPLRLAPQITVVTQTRRRDRNEVRDFSRFLNVTAARPVPVTSLTSAPPITVVLQTRRLDRSVVRDFAVVIVLRGGAVVPSRPAPQLNISRLPDIRNAQRLRERTSIVFVRGAPSLIPPRLPPQISLTLAKRRRPAPATAFVFERTAPAFVPVPTPTHPVPRCAVFPTFTSYVAAGILAAGYTGVSVLFTDVCGDVTVPGEHFYNGLWFYDGTIFYNG
jgi:hypothetical protein